MPAYRESTVDVQITEVEGHLVVKGATRDAVEAAVLEMTRRGHRQMETIQPLGRNWIATVRLSSPPGQEQAGWCEVTAIGLQVVIEASAEELARKKIAELTTFGAALVAGPECIEGKWVAVVDQRDVAPRRAG